MTVLANVVLQVPAGIEWIIIIVVIVLLFFGVKKIPELARRFGIVTQMLCRIYYILHKAVLLRRRTTVWIKPSPSLWHYKSKFGLGHLATPTVEEKVCFLQQKERGPVV
jgi:carbon starvation protein CstA